MFPPAILSQLIYNDIREGEERSGRIYEPVIGIVTDNKDPDGLIRVKVKFPTLPIPDNAAWVSVAGFGAGNDRGWYFLPEVDDEVVVMFLHGDIARPVILGAVWGGKDKAPDTNGGNNERVTIVSRQNSTIILDDDKKSITLKDGGGKGSILIEEKKITIESTTGDVCFLAPNGDLNVVAKEFDMKAKANFHLESKSGGTKMGSDAKVTLQASGMMQISGATTDLNPSGGPQAPQGGQDSSISVSDPVGD